MALDIDGSGDLSVSIHASVQELIS